VTERLPRNRWIGLRVAAVRANDDTWRAGHHAAGGALIAAAGPPLLLGITLIARPPVQIEDWFLAYAVVGVVTGGLIAMAPRQAERALGAPDEPDEPGGLR
ncbi:MAG: SdpI family protein, partial [Chloroflexota bacterium]|nr:SdpI family protein [Chloroflexota bacterium]